MTVPRSQLVDLAVTRFYHCVSRCVRQAFLCGEGNSHRKKWLENRLEELSKIFAISVCGYSAMDNHAHVVVRLDGRARVNQWSDREVAARWGRLFPKRDKRRKVLPVTKEWIDERVQDPDWVTKRRNRLASLSWFMKCLKEPLARMANKEDGIKGHFWESRYKSIAILDNEALLAACAYVDLNPLAAGMAYLPEESDHTSLKARITYCREQGQGANLEELLTHLADGSKLDSQAARELEQNVWLCPFSSPSGQTESTSDRAGMLNGYSLPQYLQLVDWTSRLKREGKAHVSEQVASILDRLGTNAETWANNLQQLFKNQERLLGVAFSFSREKLRKAANQRGCRHLVNLCGCKA